MNELILSQEDTVCFQIVKEAKTRANKYGGARRVWLKLSRKFDPTTGDSLTRQCKKFEKCKIGNIKRDKKLDHRDQTT